MSQAGLRVRDDRGVRGKPVGRSSVCTVAAGSTIGGPAVASTNGCGWTAEGSSCTIGLAARASSACCSETEGPDDRVADELVVGAGTGAVLAVGGAALPPKRIVATRYTMPASPPRQAATITPRVIQARVTSRIFILTTPSPSQ